MFLILTDAANSHIFISSFVDLYLLSFFRVAPCKFALTLQNPPVICKLQPSFEVVESKNWTRLWYIVTISEVGRSTRSYMCVVHVSPCAADRVPARTWWAICHAYPTYPTMSLSHLHSKFHLTTLWAFGFGNHVCGSVWIDCLCKRRESKSCHKKDLGSPARPAGPKSAQ